MEPESRWDLASKSKLPLFAKLPPFEKSSSMLSLITSSVIIFIYRQICWDLDFLISEEANICVKFDSKNFCFFRYRMLPSEMILLYKVDIHFVKYTCYFILHKLRTCFINIQIAACNLFKCPSIQKNSCYDIWIVALDDSSVFLLPSQLPLHLLLEWFIVPPPFQQA